MNLRDDVELLILAEFGDLTAAEAAGIAFQRVIDTLCELIGIDPAIFNDHNGDL